MKVVVAMDSFKGSLSSLEAGGAVRRGILRVCPDAGVTVIPLADGGEGTLDAIAPFTGGVTKSLTVTGPLGKEVGASYIFDPASCTAYIEMAKASGLTLVPSDELDPYRATTYGTGELIRDAIGNGAKRLFVFIGGSATNDGGAGMLEALGGRFTDKEGREICRGAIGLKDLYSADLSGLLGKGLDITVACDVTNPLCGENGASLIYGPQKGATREMAEEMDGWLRAFALITGCDPYEEGTGAAGGMSFALKNFLDARMMSGADIVMEITGANSLISDCDVVVTGEGRMDLQTVNGKAPYKILLAGKHFGKTVLGITGILGEGYEACIDAGFNSVTPLISPSMEREKALESVELTAASVFEKLIGG